MNNCEGRKLKEEEPEKKRKKVAKGMGKPTITNSVPTTQTKDFSEEMENVELRVIQKKSK